MRVPAQRDRPPGQAATSTRVTSPSFKGLGRTPYPRIPNTSADQESLTASDITITLGGSCIGAVKLKISFQLPSGNDRSQMMIGIQ